MNDGTDPPPALPAELERALSNAMHNSVGSLDTLRGAVRRHVQSRRDRGVTLGEIDIELKLLIDRVEENARRTAVGEVPDGELAGQILKWSKSFFRGSS